MSCMLKQPLETHFPSSGLGGGSWSWHGGEVLQGGDQATRGEHLGLTLHPIGPSSDYTKLCVLTHCQ